jgi:CubicO group peptidase (beta-lactamase class C family)
MMLFTAAVIASLPPTAAIERVVRDQMAQNHLRAVLVKVRSNGVDVYTGAFGESMTGVSATPDMHFRIGALAFTYMSTLLLEYVDQKKVTLDTKLSKFFPDLPSANNITLRNLSQMTSGYADYVYQPEFIDAYYRDPFKQFTPEELIRIGVSKPLQFAPGKNWGYSHTNYVILGRVLEKISGMPLDRAIRQNVFEPLGMTQTAASATAEIPVPALHAFTSERREALGVKAGIPFTEEATYWNPSWTTARGAVETGTLADLATSIEAVAAGKLLSSKSRDAMIVPSLVGFGHMQSNCPACRAMTADFNYGLGILRSRSWIAQSLGFAGASGVAGTLPPQKLTIVVEATNAPSAYDATTGQAESGATPVYKALANLLAPNTLPAAP